MQKDAYSMISSPYLHWDVTKAFWGDRSFLSLHLICSSAHPVNFSFHLLYFSSLNVHMACTLYFSYVCVFHKSLYTLSIFIIVLMSLSAISFISAITASVSINNLPNWSVSCLQSTGAENICLKIFIPLWHCWDINIYDFFKCIKVRSETLKFIFLKFLQYSLKSVDLDF